MQLINVNNDRLVLSGDLGLTQVSTLWQNLQSYPALNKLKVVDCRALSQVDSSALALLLNLQAICPNTLSLASPPPALLTLLGLYNVEDMLPLMGENA